MQVEDRKGGMNPKTGIELNALPIHGDAVLV
jgi:hypothetical protein